MAVFLVWLENTQELGRQFVSGTPRDWSHFRTGKSQKGLGTPLRAFDFRLDINLT